MPFGSYHTGVDDALRNAIRLMKEGLAEAVKLEGGTEIRGIVRRIVEAGIPVCGHIGLQPQSIHSYGTYKTRGTAEDEAKRILENAQALQDAGAFAMVVEKVPQELATRITGSVSIPTIGIGAGAGCDGQILVTPDMLGMNTQFSPRFVRRYAKLAEEMGHAFDSYRQDVRTGDFPAPNESY